MSVSMATFFGGSRKLTLAADHILSARHERLAVLDPTASLYAVRLSDARLHQPGGPGHTIVNSSGSHAMQVQDRTGTNLVSIAAGKARKFDVADNSTQAGTWDWSGEYTAVLGSMI